MSDERNDLQETMTPWGVCVPGPDGRCAPCADEAQPARVLRSETEAGLALVELAGARVEVDISLLDDVYDGDLILIHAGVAIGRVDWEAA
ncbi:MAG: hypothetical protein KatS3mg057_2811 [Herpetosiphonaceae bacterium]|nr:MAG: hypothetical protein KatS3mg057_2811 [Herpetosiphonaceae bacterium]